MREAEGEEQRMTVEAPWFLYFLQFLTRGGQEGAPDALKTHR